MNAIISLIEWLCIGIVLSANINNAVNINMLDTICKTAIRPVIILVVFVLFAFNIILKYYIMEIKSSFIFVGIIQ
ncbi:hypothetical protein baBA2_000346 [Borrelia anserina]|uniref:Uncharacterized protein n=2 Tax=Borrelia anserina TaxID=143 RepID=A0ABN4UF32_BORAN|nr:hypothetical protein [Borrelia anserina]APR64836.1 hypothetical protein N187_01725 [Borrelia anserina Es]UPA06751.1 hypothetical protein baBA2_000346 [Borrelia anserina]